MITRRTFLAHSALAAGSMLALRTPFSVAQETDQPSQSVLQSMRIAAENAAITTAKLTDTLFLIQSVGANIVVQVGPDGQLLIDSGMATATPHLLDALKKLSPHPLKLLINTSWLFDHTDGNAALHAAGAFIVAQENTRIRLSAPQNIPMLNLDLPSAPASALPQAIFADAEKLYFDNDELDLIHAPNASTDSDVFVHFVNANVIHAGELWLSEAYPIIDTASGGTINGMIQGLDQVLQLADDRTKIVPSHGNPGSKAKLAEYREMLADVANRVEKLKIAGQTLQQLIAAHVTADLDSKWAKGEMTPDMFLAAVYNTL
ncbi:MAG TPA: MBL fold metallo-hydrolase [Silvibacterium sp.]|nr:MBL fold metallo-hydrolase [Silvibacterium sp.]